MTDYKAGLRQAVSRGARQAEQAYKAKNPEAGGLRVKANVAAYQPRSKEVRELPVKAIAMFLNEPGTVALSNAELAMRLRKEVGLPVPLNILTERFPPKLVPRVQEILEMRRLKLDLSIHDTPSKVKRALKAARQAKQAETKVSVTVTFGQDAVTVGDRIYPVQKGGGVRRIHVAGRKLNVEVLAALLAGAA